MIPCGLNPAIWRQGGRIPLSTQPRSERERAAKSNSGTQAPKLAHKQATQQAGRSPPVLLKSSNPPHRHLSLQVLQVIVCTEFQSSPMLHSLSDLSGNSINNPCCNGHLNALERSNSLVQFKISSTPRLHTSPAPRCTSPVPHVVQTAC